MVTTMPAELTGPAWSRRRFLTAGAALAAAGLVAPACSLNRGSSPNTEVGLSDTESGWPGGLIEPPFPKPDVTFADLAGEPFPFIEKTEGELALLFFGYTNCPDVCPVTLNTLARSKEAIGTGAGSRPMVLFVGTDLARDTPESMTEYLDNIDPEFVGLTASEDVIDQALTALKLPSVEFEEPDENGDYLVGHPSQVFAFTPDNVAHRIFTGFGPGGMRQEDWATVLPKLAVGEYQ